MMSSWLHRHVKLNFKYLLNTVLLTIKSYILELQVKATYQRQTSVEGVQMKGQLFCPIMLSSILEQTSPEPNASWQKYTSANHLQSPTYKK